MRQPLLLITFFLSTTFSFAQQTLQRISKFEDYIIQLEKSRRNGQMLFIALMDEKMESKSMRNNVFIKDTALTSALTPYVALEFYANTDMGQRWSRAFTVDKLPSFFIINAEEIILETIDGYQTSNELISFLNKHQGSKNLYSTLNTKYGLGQLTNEEWIQLISIHQINFTYHQTSKLALEFLNSLSKQELVQKSTIPVLTTYGIDLETKFPRFILSNYKVLVYTDTTFNYDNWFKTTYEYNMDRAIYNKDTSLLNKVVNPLIQNSQEEAKAELIFHTRVNYAEETERYAIIYEAVMDYTAGIEDSAMRSRYIFDEAFNLADQKQDADAQKVAHKLAHEANNLTPDFRYKMLESYTAYKLGNYSKATELVEEAKALAKTGTAQSKAISLSKMIARAQEKN